MGHPLSQPLRNAGFVPRAGSIACAALLAGCSVLGIGNKPMVVMPRAPVMPEMPPPAMMPAMPETTPPEMPEMASVTPPIPKPLPKPPAPSRRPTPPRPPEVAPPPPPALPPPVAVNSLIGSDFAGVRQIFRPPDTVQNSNLSIVWIYSQPGCTLQLFFYPDIATTMFRLLRYDFRNAAGEVLMSGDPCMQAMLANRGAAK